MKIYPAFFRLFLLLACTSANAVLPPAYEAGYDVKKYRVTVGHSKVELKKQKDKFHYSQQIKLVGLAALLRKDIVTEQSWLSRNDEGDFELERYQYEHRRSKDKNNWDILLEASWQQHENEQSTAHFSGTVHGAKTDIATKGEVWDSFSVQLALMNAVSNKENNLNYQVISKGRLKRYMFTYKGRETLTLDETDYETIRFSRSSGSKVLKIWLAPELHHVPVKLEKYEEGKLDTSITLDTISFEEQSPLSEGDDE